MWRGSSAAYAITLQITHIPTPRAYLLGKISTSPLYNQIFTEELIASPEEVRRRRFVKNIICVPCVEALGNSAECVPFYPYIVSLGYLPLRLASQTADQRSPLTEACD